MSKLFVYGIDQSASNHVIQGEFEKFGMVRDVYAFVTFDRKKDADTAMDAMGGQTILGQQIKVNEAKPREDGGGGRGDGGSWMWRI